MARRIDYTALTMPLNDADVAAFTAETTAAGNKWMPRTASPQATTIAWVLLCVFFVLPLVVALSLVGIAFVIGYPLLAITALPALFFAGLSGFFAIPTVRKPLRPYGWDAYYRLARFAWDNNLEFNPSTVGQSYPGLLFQNIPTIERYNRLSSREGPYFDLGNLRYNAHIGQLSEMANRGYLAIELENPVPHVVLDARKNNDFGLSLSSQVSMNPNPSLEGDFDNHFAVFCEPGYERDVLYLLTPDLMALLVDESFAFDVELVDKWMLIYSMSSFDSLDPAVYDRLLRIVDTVGAKGARRTREYEDELRPGARTAGAGRLRFGVPKYLLICILGLVASFWLAGAAFVAFVDHLSRLI